MKVSRLLFAVLLAVALVPVASYAVPVDYAHLDQGASIVSISSALTGYQYYPDPRDMIGGRDVVEDGYSRYSSGEKGNFIFDRYDLDQHVIVDLGTERSLDEVGARFVPYPDDREVWDYLGVSVGLDATSFALVGSIGSKGDHVRDVNESLVMFDLLSPVTARYVLYEFGEYSHDWGGGSRVYDVYAKGEQMPVPEPASLLLLGSGLIGFVSLRKKLGFCKK